MSPYQLNEHSEALFLPYAAKIARAPANLTGSVPGKRNNAQASKVKRGMFALEEWRR